MSKQLLLLLLCAFFAALGTAKAGSTYILAFESPLPTTAPVTEPLDVKVTVTADSNQQLVPGVEVKLSYGQNSVVKADEEIDTETTDANGVATFQFTLPEIGTYSFVATAVDTLESTTSEDLEGVAGPASKLVFEPIATGKTALDPFDVTAKLTDSQGNPVDFGSAVTIALSGGIGTLAGTTTLTVAGDSAQFTSLSIDEPGTYTLTVTADQLTNSTNIIILGGAATKFEFSTDPSGAKGGETFTTQPVVQLVDDAGNFPSSGANAIEVTLSLVDEAGIGATLAGTATGTTDSTGKVVFNGLSINKVGTYKLSVSTVGETPFPSVASQEFSVTAGSPYALTFSAQPGSSTGGVPSQTQPVVQVVDKGGNNATTVEPISVSLSLYDSQEVLDNAAAVDTDTDGKAAFDNISVKKVGTYKLKAAATALEEIVSQEFTISAGPAANVTFITQPEAGEGGGRDFTTAPIVQIVDAGGNPVTENGDILVKLSIKGSPAGVTLSGVANATAGATGLYAFSGLSIDKVGTYVLVATINVDDNDVQSDSQEFTVAVGEASKVVFSTQPGDSTGGAKFSQQPVVQLVDAGGNNVPTSDKTVVLSINATSSTDVNAKLGGVTSVVTDAAGVATFDDVSIDKIGTYHLICEVTGLVTSESSAVVITLGAAAHLVFTIQPVDTPVWKTFATVQVTIVDAGNNTVTTSNDEVSVLATGNPEALSSLAHAVSGVANFTIIEFHEEGTFTLTAALDDVSGVSDEFVVLGNITWTVSERFTINTVQTMKLELSSNAPVGGATFNLATEPTTTGCVFKVDQSEATSVTFTEGTKSKDIDVTCPSPSLGVTFKATRHEGVKYADGVSNPADIQGNVTLSGAADAVVGDNTTVTITIEPVAPAGGVIFTMSSNNVDCSFKVESEAVTSVTVAEGATQASFVYTCSSINTDNTANITVTTGSNYVSATTTAFSVKGLAELTGHSDVLTEQTSNQVSLKLTPAAATAQQFTLSATGGGCSFTGTSVENSVLTVSVGADEALFTYNCTQPTADIKVEAASSLSYSSPSFNFTAYSLGLSTSFVEIIKGVCSEETSVTISPVSTVDFDAGLTSSGGLCTFYKDAECKTSQETLSMQANSATSASKVYVLCTTEETSQTITVTPSAESKIAGTFTPSGFAVSTYEFSGVSNTLTDSCSGPAVVIVSPAISAEAGKSLAMNNDCTFYTESDCSSTSTISSVAIQYLQTSSSAFYYKCGSTGYNNVTGQPTNVQSVLSSRIHVATYGFADVLQSIAKGICSQPVTVTVSPNVEADTKVDLTSNCQLFDDAQCSSAIDHVVIAAAGAASPQFYYYCSDLATNETITASPESYITSTSTSFNVTGLTAAPSTVVKQAATQSVVLPGSTNGDKAVLTKAASCPTSNEAAEADSQALVGAEGEKVLSIAGSAVVVAANELGLYNVCYRASHAPETAGFALTDFQLDIHGVSAGPAAVVKQGTLQTIALTGSTDGDFVVVTGSDACPTTATDDENALVDLDGNKQFTVSSSSVSLVAAKLGSYRVCYKLAAASEETAFVDTTFALAVRGLSSQPTPVAKQAAALSISLPGSTSGDNVVLTKTSCPASEELLDASESLSDGDASFVLAIADDSTAAVSPAVTGDYNICYRLSGETGVFVHQFVLSVRGVNASSPVAKDTEEQTILLSSSVDGDEVVITKSACPSNDDAANSLHSDTLQSDVTGTVLVVSGGAVTTLPANITTYNICYRPAGSASEAFINQSVNVTVTGATAVVPNVVAKTSAGFTFSLTSATHGDKVVIAEECPSNDAAAGSAILILKNETISYVPSALGTYKVCYKPAALNSSFAFVDQGFEVVVRGTTEVSPNTYVRSVNSATITLIGSTDGDSVVLTAANSACPSSPATTLTVKDAAVSAILTPGSYKVCYRPAQSTGDYVDQSVTITVAGATATTPQVLPRSSVAREVQLTGATADDKVVFTTASTCPGSDEVAEAQAAGSLLAEDNSAVHTLALRHVASTSANIIIVGTAAKFIPADLGTYRVCYKMGSADEDTDYVDQGIFLTVRGLESTSVRIASTISGVQQSVSLPGSTTPDNVVITKTESCPASNDLAGVDAGALSSGTSSKVLQVSSTSSVVVSAASTGSYRACYKPAQYESGEAFVYQEGFQLKVAGLVSITANSTFTGSAITATLTTANVEVGDKVVLTTGSCPANDPSADRILYVNFSNNTYTVTTSLSTVGAYKVCFKTRDASTDSPFYQQSAPALDFTRPLSASSSTVPSLLVLIILSVAWLFV